MTQTATTLLSATAAPLGAAGIALGVGLLILTNVIVVIVAVAKHQTP